MTGWDWLTRGSYTLGFMLRVALKAALLFGLFNVLWMVTQPMPALGHLSVYGWLVPYRERLPFGESPDAYNLSTDSLETMIATHAIRAPKADDEFRVVLIGDSATWGILLRPAETLAAQLNSMALTTADGRRVRFYNLAHPIMSLTKDLLLLDEARRYAPDLIVWLNTLESFYRPEQLEPPLVQANAARVRDLIQRYDLALDPAALPAPSPIEQTFIAQRRLVADWWRLQWYGFAWATTGIDQIYPAFTPRTSDFEPDASWKRFEEPDDLWAAQALAFDVIAAAHTMMGDVPILLVNQPIFRSAGINSEIRYNLWYPRWAFDQFRRIYQQQAAFHSWHFSDLWDVVAPERFTDSPVHLDAAGVQTLAQALMPSMQRLINLRQDTTP